MSQDVREFFDAHARGYQSRDVGMRAYHRSIARRLQRDLSGTVLCVGGLWAQAEAASVRARLVVTDASLGMLRGFASGTHDTAVADAFRLPFADESFDHAVFPLVLHHLAGKSVSEGRDQIRTALLEAKRVLRPGAKVWISELCVSRATYALERIFAPFTRWLLARVGEPFVAMHPASVFAAELDRCGFRDTSCERVRPPGVSSLDTVIPIIAAPWMKVPRFLFPLRSTLIAARSPTRSDGGC